jgi:hypothetical protein
MFEKYKRSRDSNGTFKKDVRWTPWNEAWEYRMSDELKDMLERVAWTFIEAFIGALTIAPLVGIEAETVQLAALSGGAAALAVVKAYAKKQLGGSGTQKVSK